MGVYRRTAVRSNKADIQFDKKHYAMTTKYLFKILTSLLVTTLLFQCTNSMKKESISFYNVPLKCGAAPDIGCGSRIKPLFLDTEKETAVKESWTNRQGTILAFVWDENATPDEREKALKTLFEKHDIEADYVSDETEQGKLQTSFSSEKDKWLKGMDVDKLSLEEAGVIANEMVTFAKRKSLMNNLKADSIKTELENYFKAELVKVRTYDELSSIETREKWRTDVGQIVSKYIGKEKTAALSEAYLTYCEEIEKSQESCCKEDKKECCKKLAEKSLTSEITCPKCGHKATETMPTEVCQLIYKCKQCGHEMHPKDDDCCVFCSYSDHKCPSKQ